MLTYYHVRSSYESKKAPVLSFVFKRKQTKCDDVIPVSTQNGCETNGALFLYMIKILIFFNIFKRKQRHEITRQNKENKGMK